ETGIDVGGDPGPASQCRPSLLRATKSDFRSARLRQVRGRALRALLCGRRSAGSAAGSVLSAAADRLLRGARRRACDRVASSRFLCTAPVSRVGLAGGATGPFDDLSNASLDRSGDARGGLHVDSCRERSHSSWVIKADRTGDTGPTSLHNTREIWRGSTL